MKSPRIVQLAMFAMVVFRRRRDGIGRCQLLIHHDRCPRSLGHPSLRDQQQRPDRGILFDSSRGHGFLDTGGIFTTIDVPGATSTSAFGINDSGQIVGSFYDGTTTHGFLATPVPEPSSLPRS